MFCKYCGTQVPDGYVCNCPDAQKERAAAANVATAAPAAAPAAGNDIGKKIGDAFKGIPAASKKLLQDASGHNQDLGSAIIFACVCLIGYILGYVLLFSAMFGDMMKYMDGFVGTLIWAGCVTCIVSMAISFVIGLIVQAIRKEKVDALASFIKTACQSVTPALLFLLASILMYISAGLSLFMVLVTIIAGGQVYANRLAGDKKKAGILGVVITSLVLAVAIVIVGWLVINVFTGYLESKLGGFDITDLMGVLR